MFNSRKRYFYFWQGKKFKIYSVVFQKRIMYKEVEKAEKEFSMFEKVVIKAIGYALTALIFKIANAIK